MATEVINKNATLKGSVFLCTLKYKINILCKRYLKRRQIKGSPII